MIILLEKKENLRKKRFLKRNSHSGEVQVIEVKMIFKMALNMHCMSQTVNGIFIWIYVEHENVKM